MAKRIDEATRKQIIELNWKERYSMQQIADLVGISTTTVRKILKEDKENPDFSEIEGIDKRLKEIHEEQQLLENERNRLQLRRFDLLRNSKNSTMDFILYQDNRISTLYRCKISIKNNEYEQILYDGRIRREYPDHYDLCIAHVYNTALRNDFETVWHAAYVATQKAEDEEWERQKEQEEQIWKEREQEREKTFQEWEKQLNDLSKHSQCDISEQSKRQIINVLVKIFHPDRLGQETIYKNTNPNTIKDVLKLKEYLS